MRGGRFSFSVRRARYCYTEIWRKNDNGDTRKTAFPVVLVSDVVSRIAQTVLICEYETCASLSRALIFQPILSASMVELAGVAALPGVPGARTLDWA